MNTFDSIRVEINSRMDLINLWHPSTVDHSIAVSKLMRNYAKVNYDGDQWLQEVYELAGLAHDGGKLEVMDAILENEGMQLCRDSHSMYMLRDHVGHGRNWFRKSMPLVSSEISSILLAIQCHHERWDGKGYPLRLSGEEIPLIARVTAVCCSYDAMVGAGRNWTMRRYSHDDALSELRSCASTQFDANVVELFCGMGFNE